MESIKEFYGADGQTYLLPFAVTFVNGEQGHLIENHNAMCPFPVVQRLCVKDHAMMVNANRYSQYRVSEYHKTHCILPDYHPVHRVGLSDNREDGAIE